MCKWVDKPTEPGLWFYFEQAWKVDYVDVLYVEQKDLDLPDTSRDILVPGADAPASLNSLNGRWMKCPIELPKWPEEVAFEKRLKEINPATIPS